MKGFENDDLFGLITVEETDQRFGCPNNPRRCKSHRLIDEIAIRSAVYADPKSLRQAIDIGATVCQDTWYSTNNVKCERIMVDAGYKTKLHPLFNRSRDSARLAAILAMRAIRRLGSIYRDPARMVGRAIWAQRAYYLEESERALKK